jgi:PAS domain S-box-containing protein
VTARPDHTAQSAADTARLAENPAVHRALLDAVLDPTVAIDAYGTIVLASASVETVLGWKPGELCGNNIRVLMGEPHHARHDEYLANYRRTGETHILNRTREFEVIHKSGRVVNCELSVARAELDQSGPLFIGTFRDVTERRAFERALEDSERRFRAIFDSAYEFVGLLQPDGTLLEANRAALEAIGAEREAVVGKKFWDTPWWHLPEVDREQLKNAIREAAQGRFVRFETAHAGRGDELLIVDFSLNPILDASGQVVLIVPEGRNITELKRAQRAETAMLRALATIGESSAMLAHEIKNPITAVNLALRAVANLLGEDERDVLADLVSRMQRLEALMRRTLSFAKPLELKLSTVGARDLLEGVARDLAPEAAKRGCELSVEVQDGLAFHADRQLIDEVLVNLVKNALEAGAENARVVVAARRDGASGIVLTVDDNGPGIPQASRSDVFKPFHTTKHKGTGLGLAFCRKVINEHGGSIEAKDSDLGGARFEIHLPTSV